MLFLASFLTLQPYNEMQIKVIKTEKQHQEVLDRMEEIFDSKQNSNYEDELDLLAFFIEKYENEHYAINFPDPIEAIKFRMDQLGFKQKDLAMAIGLKSRVSEILNRKRKLTIDMVRKLNATLGIPTDVLIREYQKFLTVSPLVQAPLSQKPQFKHLDWGFGVLGC